MPIEQHEQHRVGQGPHEWGADGQLGPVAPNGPTVTADDRPSWRASVSEHPSHHVDTDEHNSDSVALSWYVCACSYTVGPGYLTQFPCSLRVPPLSLCAALCQPADDPGLSPTRETATVATQTKEDPAACGKRLAEEALPRRYALSALAIRKTIVKRLSAHVRLPRATGSMSWKFKLDLAPLEGVREICEAAGMQLQYPLKFLGSGRSTRTRRTWRATGPSATSKFASLQMGHPLAWGGGKLVKAPKGSTRQVSRQMTLLAPPLTVEHTIGKDESSTTISGHLVTFNETGQMRLPPKHEELWGSSSAATTRVLSKYAKKMLEGMYLEGMPLSKSFKQQMERKAHQPEYPSSEESEEEAEEEVAEVEVEELEDVVEELLEGRYRDRHAKGGAGEL